MFAKIGGTNRASNSTVAQHYDHSKLPTTPILFHVTPFDGQNFLEYQNRVPNVDKGLESAYMGRLRNLYGLPGDTDTRKMLAFLRNLLNLKKNNSVELIDEQLQRLSEQRLIGTLEILKGDIIKKSWTKSKNIGELIEKYIVQGDVFGVAARVAQDHDLFKGIDARGEGWRKMEIYEINHTTIALTLIFLKDNRSTLKATTSKQLKFFRTVIVGEMFAAKIIIRYHGFEYYKNISRNVVSKLP